MTSIDSPLHSLLSMYDRITSIDWGYHRTQLAVSVGVFLGYLLASLMFLAMVAMAIGRGLNHLRRSLPNWLRALATQLDRLNAWLDEGAQPEKSATPQPAAVFATEAPAADTPREAPTRAPRNRNRRRQHTHTATA